MSRMNPKVANWIRSHLNLIHEGGGQELFYAWEEEFKTDSHNGLLSKALMQVYNAKDYVRFFHGYLPYRSFNHGEYSEIVFPNPVNIISNRCFYDCLNLVSIDVSKSYSIKIEEGAFNRCPKLQRVLLGKPDYFLIDATCTLDCPSNMVFVYDGIMEDCYEAMEVSFHSSTISNHSLHFECEDGILEVTHDNIKRHPIY